MLVVTVKIRGRIETLALQTVLYYTECMNNRCLVSRIHRVVLKWKCVFNRTVLYYSIMKAFCLNAGCYNVFNVGLYSESFLFDCLWDRCEWHKEMKGYSVYCWTGALLCRDEVLELISHHFIFSNSSCFQINFRPNFYHSAAGGESAALKLDWEQCSQWSVITAQDTV